MVETEAEMVVVAETMEEETAVVEQPKACI